MTDDTQHFCVNLGSMFLITFFNLFLILLTTISFVQQVGFLPFSLKSAPTTSLNGYLYWNRRKVAIVLSIDGKRATTVTPCHKRDEGTALIVLWPKFYFHILLDSND
jgi:hypothetical protein